MHATGHWPFLGPVYRSSSELIMYTALGVFLRAMLLSQMYVNDDFMHPCFHHRFTSESSIHTEQTLKFSLWATSVCVSFVCFLDEVGHAKPSKCTHLRLFSAGTLRKIKQRRHQVTGNVRLHAVPQTAGVCDCKHGSLSVVHSIHWTYHRQTLQKDDFSDCQSSRSVQTCLWHSQTYGDARRVMRVQTVNMWCILKE